MLKYTLYPILVLFSYTGKNQAIEEEKSNMETKDFTTTIFVSQQPEQVYKAINNVRGWWSEEIEGETEKLNAVFNYHFQDVHRCKMKITTLIPGKKVVWRVEENYFKFTSKQNEWPGTEVIFEISKAGEQTKLVFTHKGLQPKDECYKICHDAWTNYIQISLRELITKGKGKPNGKEKAQTDDEKKLSSGK
ncbi:SRPBCC domain-containing protein [Pedobacter aquatilis]|uniref:SRPBCC family protein n=1 Tax=Pedobacter aquatilis TaxID=351343 RepID=UPI0029308226|nr:SRPBCC domain-containing protein [Pedobacter aquatilis]